MRVFNALERSMDKPELSGASSQSQGVQKLEVFISYAHEDVPLAIDLQT
jgi:hypothetical protein